ncbi:MAG: SRPBCC domain-containing protein [Cyclobacteriaceae bacterium]
MITVKSTLELPLAKVWDYWTTPAHIIHWNFASEDWHCPKAENNLIKNGSFCYTMAAKDGSAQFDFKGQYQSIEPMKTIEYIIEDGRRVRIEFEILNEAMTTVSEHFEPEQIHSEELQKQGWQAILNQFKKYAESVREI